MLVGLMQIMQILLVEEEAALPQVAQEVERLPMVIPLVVPHQLLDAIPVRIGP